MTALLAVVLAAALDAADLEALDRLAGAWSRPSAAAADEARERFAGRGEAVAAHFLRHTDPRPPNDAFFFVLRELGEPGAAIQLAEALPEPPPVSSGVLDRHWTEIDAALEAALESDPVRRDPRVVAALTGVIATAREKPWNAAAAEAAVGLLGRCRAPEAVAALRGLARDADPVFRAAAAQALGNLHTGDGRERADDAGDLTPVQTTLAATLRGDPSAAARRQAAAALAQLGEPAGVDALREALRAEQDPEVVDAVVGALERLGAPPEDRALVGDVLGRAHEAAAVRPLFERWRGDASVEELVETAATAPLPFRALALETLTRPPDSGGLVKIPSPPDPGSPRAGAPPPADGGAAAVSLVAPHAPLPGSRRRGSRPPQALDPATKERLAGAAVEVLAVPTAHSTHEAALAALWQLVGGSMETALDRTDDIAALDQRYWASAGLHRIDPAAYASVRQRDERIAAGVLALPLLGLLAWAPARRAAAVALAAVLVWGATAPLGSTLSLPPWPFPFTGPRFLVCAAAGAAVIATLGVRRFRALAAAALAGVVFFVTWLATREMGLYPPDTQSGYVFLFEPILGIPLAALLTIPLVLVSLRRSRPEPA